MKLFVQPTPAPEVKLMSKVIALMYAAIIVIMLIAQLFTFEDFIKLFESFDFRGGSTLAYFVAASLVSAELLALPFLLRMSLSPAFRILSAGCGWIVALYWVAISVWVITMVPEATSVGLLGTVVDTGSGVFALLFSIIFVAMAAWTSITLVSRRSSRYHKKKK